MSIGAEFTELMDAFNAMASKLDQTESTRKRLLSDLAHEMRTPVATVDGYLEAMQDGVAQADDETLVMLREQTARLTRLAEDISLVSAAEERHLSMKPAPARWASCSRPPKLRQVDATGRKECTSSSAPPLSHRTSWSVSMAGASDRCSPICWTMLCTTLIPATK